MTFHQYKALAEDLHPLQAGDKLDIETVYADPGHPENVFVLNGTALYRAEAAILLCQKLKVIVERAVELTPADSVLRIYDGFRPTEAQEAMKFFKKSLNIPEDMLSEPGQGGHPRGMAVDCALVHKEDGYARRRYDYGTGFDDFALDDGNDFRSLNEPPSGVAFADRNFKHHGFSVAHNRLRLEALMQKAALAEETVLCPLPSEWWDFRFPKNEADLKYVLASFNRLLFNDYGPAPEIETYEAFTDYWHEHYTPQIIPAEKRFIFGTTPKVPPREKIIFYNDHPPLSEKDVNAVGYKILADRPKFPDPFSKQP